MKDNEKNNNSTKTNLLKNFSLDYPKLSQIISYGFWGVLTTIINIITFWIFRHFNLVNTTISAGIAWFISVLFAYITNRIFVYHSDKTVWRDIAFECFKFFSSRLFSGIVDILFLLLLTKIFIINENIAKIISNILVIILNYFIGLFAVFTPKSNK